MEKFNHLAGTRVIADPSCANDQPELDILIGLDHYWSNSSGDVVHGKPALPFKPKAIDWTFQASMTSPGNSQGM